MVNYNIISNTCIGSYITTKCLMLPLQNPFSWSVIDSDSILALLEHFYDIDFSNIRVNQVSDFYKITIDNVVSVNYIHYHYSKTATNLVQHGPDLFFNQMADYVTAKYFERLKRMALNNSKPIFVLGFANGKANSKWYWTENDVNKVLNATSNYNIIASFEYNVNHMSNNNIEYIPQHQTFIDNGLEFSKYIFDTSTFFSKEDI